MNANNHSNERESTPKRDFLWKTPWLKVSWLLGALLLFISFILLQLSIRSEYLTPGFVHLQNNLGYILFCLMALFCLLISGAILQRAWEKKNWNHQESVMFYCGLLLACVFYITGFQFLLFGEWKYDNPNVYFFLKGLTIFLFLMILVIAIRGEIRDKKDSSNQATKE